MGDRTISTMLATGWRQEKEIKGDAAVSIKRRLNCLSIEAAWLFIPARVNGISYENFIKSEFLSTEDDDDNDDE